MAESPMKIRAKLNPEQMEALTGLSRAVEKVHHAMSPRGETLENPQENSTAARKNATRRAAFGAINSERDYQDERWGHDRVHSPAEWILFLEHHIAKARSIAATEPSLVMHEIRKVAALAVAAMEVNGSPER